ncbi:MAG: hypothetical protein F2909_01985 [Actinobacteria bacterium]|uniref:Unannotated protein n=1 Tax=freshwater metagenome TaxID=449393 RepID=A0A6J6XKE6_9ZZZZ|nr:hypothetical protein [Actinomycetota bacterium]MSX15079.1 hypothetical protein [Actinomycetota bacterium]MSX36053.1 hypothetical protein [Actinomycetota bacterium]MSX76746.1 hypothetical protein [Actinomycetota bacterium]MSZ71255.1 hypothetical protein [Actinomycetota bacterium]
MRNSHFRVNSLVALIAAAASMFSYCLTSQALDSSPSHMNCINTLDLSAVSNSTSPTQNANRFVALTCGQEATTPHVFTTAVALRSLNP